MTVQALLGPARSGYPLVAGGPRSQHQRTTHNTLGQDRVITIQTLLGPAGPPCFTRQSGLNL